MHALTIREPWASAIVFLGKDVENRTWITGLRGDLAIHCALSDDVNASPDVGMRLSSHVTRGAVVAVVELQDIVANSDSEWAWFGYWHWLIANVRQLVIPLPVRGHQGLWRLPDPVADEVRRQL